MYAGNTLEQSITMNQSPMEIVMSAMISAHSVNERIGYLHTYVLGDEPEACGKDDLPTTAGGRIGELERAAQQLQISITTAHRLISDLEAALR